MAIGNEGTADAAVSGKDNNNFSSDVEGLKKSFSQLRTDLMGLLDNALGVGKTGVHIARDGAGAAVDGIKHRMSDLKDKGVNSAHAFEDKVSEHPITGLLIAFAVGYIVGKMLNRR